MRHSRNQNISLDHESFDRLRITLHESFDKLRTSYTNKTIKDPLSADAVCDFIFLFSGASFI